LTQAVLQEYYKLLFEEIAQMKRQKQKEEKENAQKIVYYLYYLLYSVYYIILSLGGNAYNFK
jgi:hypothetical protein